VPRIKDKDAGSSEGKSEMWQTPTAVGIDERSQESLIKKKEKRNASGRKTVPPGSLQEQIKLTPEHEQKPSWDMTNKIKEPLPNKKNLWSTPTASDRYSAHMKPNEKGIPHDIAKGNLRGEVKFWPTPTVDNNEHKNLKLDEKGRRIASKSGGGTHSLNLADTVNMWPTPAVADTEGGEQSKRVERTDSGSYILRKKNKPEMTYGAKLSDAILFEEKQEMWPTPTAHNAKEGAYPAEFKRNTPSLVIEAQRRNDSGDQSAEDLPNTTSGEAGTEKVKANLNPDWVEWLMGYPEGYSDTEKTEKQSINEHEGWWFEPDIPRITPRKDLRTKRLKCLGNSIVPQIVVEIGKAILEQEKKDAS